MNDLLTKSENDVASGIINSHELEYMHYLNEPNEKNRLTYFFELYSDFFSDKWFDDFSDMAYYIVRIHRDLLNLPEDKVIDYNKLLRTFNETVEYGKYILLHMTNENHAASLKAIRNVGDVTTGLIFSVVFLLEIVFEYKYKNDNYQTRIANIFHSRWMWIENYINKYNYRVYTGESTLEEANQERENDERETKEMAFHDPRTIRIQNAIAAAKSEAESKLMEFKCPICFEEFTPSDEYYVHFGKNRHGDVDETLAHIFHKQCLAQYCRDKPECKCPICKDKLKDIPVYREVGGRKKRRRKSTKRKCNKKNKKTRKN